MKDSNEHFFQNLRSRFRELGMDDPDTLTDFARHLFRLTTPVDEMAREPLSDVCGLVRSLWRHFQAFPGGARAPRVLCFNPNLEEEGWEHRDTQVFVLQEDMAFLVDSVRMALERKGLGVHSINSTLFDTERDEQGRLQAFDEAGAGGDRREALIYFQVDRFSGDERRREIVEEVVDVLETVRVVNEDHRAQLNLLTDIIEGLGQSAGLQKDPARAEELAFLEWLKDEHFSFLGYSYYHYNGDHDPLVTHREERQLGLLRRHPRQQSPARLSSLPPGFRDFYHSDALLDLAKSSRRSRVHRDAYCDYVLVKDFDDSGRQVGEHRFLGLYTSRVYAGSPFNIPLVRWKLNRVFERSGLDPSAHYGKVLRQIMEVHPREELFNATEDQLYEILIGIWRINERRRVRLFIRTDPYEKFVNCLVYFPRDNYRTEIRERTEALLKEALDASESQFTTIFTESRLARTHFVMRICSERYRKVDSAELEAEIASFTNNWGDDLAKAIVEHWGDEKGLAMLDIYREAFPVSYQSHFDPRAAVHDIELFHGLADDQQIAMQLFQPQGVAANTLRFKIFHRGSELSLSDMVPRLENLGFHVVGEHPYPIQPAEGPVIWMHDFTLQFALDIAIDVPGIRQNFLDAFEAVWLGRTDDDSFNWLVVGARLDWRAVSLIRMYARYMKQLGMTISQEFIAATLSSQLEITRNLVALFKTRFDPRLSDHERAPGERGERLREKVLEGLEGVDNLNQDQVLRTYLRLIEVTVRTNYFQRNAAQQHKDYLCIKLMPRSLGAVPEPRPEYEIFVYSPRVEGVHLRAGKVARGGIRWSDRLEDYRTEVLGLVKAQQVKNAVIVPSGAKGGFIVRRPPAGGRQEMFAEGQACYRTFMRALLDVTDNIRGGEVVPPPEVVRHDGDDAYLVVAADKGTATFSDLANEVSAEYGHWLGDAFASGGRYGYDHKKMAITARGGWVAVQRHFRELGINIQEEDFTVLGIGDMAGDVFGNGMLLSHHICLVAAFNHRSIFIDPHPDPAASYRERQRLFDTPGSTWEDYDRSLISAGGGVFSRSAKSLPLSPEIRRRFDIAEEELTPAQLIHRLLQAQVDLIWNGGIGTYVKGANESSGQVGDRANDELRVDGRQLRCRVFGEGGNLGMTQKGRIEYSLNGGACNTDFIDNSGGVDCSDQEVNIKILLNQMVVDQDLTPKQRNTLLEDMTGQVAEGVLRHNYKQTQAISLARYKCQFSLSEYWLCLSDWEAQGVLDRNLEDLPDDETLADREKTGKSLTRPELAVLMAYSKILFKEQLLASRISEDPGIGRQLEKAFPALLVERYPEKLAGHTLRREILCNQLANEIIDIMGLTFVHRQGKSTGATAGEVARAYITVRNALDLEAVWQEVEALDYEQPAEQQFQIQLKLMRLGRRSTRWVIRNRRTCVNTDAEVNTLQPLLQQLLDSNVEFYAARRDEEDSDMAGYRAMGLSDYAAMLVDSANDLFFAFGMADTSVRTGASIERVNDVYNGLGELLQLDWFSRQITALPANSRWEDFAREAFMDELEGLYRSLAVAVLEELEPDTDIEQRLARWRESQEALVQRWQSMIHELRVAPTRNFAMFSVALRELQDLVDTTRQAGNLAYFCGAGEEKARRPEAPES